MNHHPTCIVAVADKTHGWELIFVLLQSCGSACFERNESKDREDAVVVVKEEDIAAATSVTRPSALREITVEVPHVRWTDIGGQEDVKRLVKETIEWPLRHADAFQKMGIEPPRGVLLYVVFLLLTHLHRTQHTHKTTKGTVHPDVVKR